MNWELTGGMNWGWAGCCRCCSSVLLSPAPVRPPTRPPTRRRADAVPLDAERLLQETLPIAVLTLLGLRDEVEVADVRFVGGRGAAIGAGAGAAAVDVGDDGGAVRSGHPVAAANAVDRVADLNDVVEQAAQQLVRLRRQSNGRGVRKVESALHRLQLLRLAAKTAAARPAAAAAAETAAATAVAEWQSRREDDVKGDAERPDVGLTGVVRLLFQHLRRPVPGRRDDARRPAPVEQFVAGAKPQRRPEVAQLDAIVFVEDEVLAADVAMDDRLRVQVADGFDHVAKVTAADGFRQQTAGRHRQQLAEASVLAEFENEADATVDHVVLVHTNDVAMLQFAVELNLERCQKENSRMNSTSVKIIRGKECSFSFCFEVNCSMIFF